MKKFIIPFLAILIVISSCHKKAVPQISSRTEFPPPPNFVQRTAVDDRPETIAAGQIVFTAKCKSCHELKDTRIYTMARWSSILGIMIPRAKLNEEEGREVTSYVMANAKK